MESDEREINTIRADQEADQWQAARRDGISVEEPSMAAMVRILDARGTDNLPQEMRSVANELLDHWAESYNVKRVSE